MAADEVLDRATAEKIIDEERGTVFNWLEFPQFLELEKGRVSEYPDRTFINDVIEMLKTDGQAAGVEQALTMALRQANLTIEQPEGPNAKRITELVEDVLMRPAVEGGMTTPFDLVFGQMTFASATCRTFHEMVWTRREDGKLGFSKIAWRPPGSCEILRHRDTGEPDGYKQFVDWDWQRSQTRKDVDWRGYVEIPANRAVVHVNNQHRDPVYGWSDLSVTHWAFQLKRKVMLLWATLLGRVAEPWVIAYGKNPTEATANAKKIASLKSGGVAAVTRSVGTEEGGRGYDVIDVAGQGAQMYLEALRYLDGMMSQSVLGGWMDLAGAASQSGAGSYALSADQSGLFLQSRHGAARELCATVNYQIIRQLVRVNFGPKAPVPLLKIEKIGQDQIAKAMELLSTLGSGTQLQVPHEFIGMLIERVASFLDLPDDRVRKMVAEFAKQARLAAQAAGAPQPPEGSPEGELQDAVNGALGVVESEGPRQGAVPAAQLPGQGVTA